MRIVLQTLFLSVPQVQARPKIPQSNNPSATLTNNGYISNFTDRISAFFAGDEHEPASIGEVERGLPDGTVMAFGPKRFTRTNGAPNNYVETFTMPFGCTNGTYKIVVRNGEQNGANRISSAVIKLNGISLFTQSDFNQNVYYLEKPVTLAATNTLEIRLASAPNSYLTIDVTGENCGPTDTIPPTLVITSLEDNKATTDASITISGTAEDLGTPASGIAQVWLNNSVAPYNAATKVWEVASVPLSVGTNTFTFRTADNAGNESTSQVTIIRDLTQPTISISSPSDGAITLNQAYFDQRQCF